LNVSESERSFQRIKGNNEWGRDEEKRRKLASNESRETTNEEKEASNEFRKTTNGEEMKRRKENWFPPNGETTNREEDGFTSDENGVGVTPSGGFWGRK
jgi:hypothetical protein